MARRSVRDEICDLVVEASHAWARGDLPTLQQMLADEYVHTDIAGRVKNRAEWLQQLGSRASALEIAFDDLDVREYGDVAVVTGRNTASPPVIRAARRAASGSSRRTEGRQEGRQGPLGGRLG
jgi:ketosteroid isomerase-like protein